MRGKVVVFFGSPRKNGNTARLVQQAMDGAKAAGAEVTSYYLNDEGIRGCQGCGYCRGHEGCATKDALSPMYEEIKRAGGIIAGFPIYFGNISGQSKVWIDRLYPMLGGEFSPRYPGKKAVTVYSQANNDNDMFKKAIDTNDTFFKLFGWELADSILSYGSAQPDYSLPQELLDRAFEAGKRLVAE
jgi:multimeric flavodoxin WrbA